MFETTFSDSWAILVMTAVLLLLLFFSILRRQWVFTFFTLAALYVTAHIATVPYRAVSDPLDAFVEHLRNVTVTLAGRAPYPKGQLPHPSRRR